jgi:hypothetical protein
MTGAPDGAQGTDWAGSSDAVQRGTRMAREMGKQRVITTLKGLKERESH